MEEEKKEKNCTPATISNANKYFSYWRNPSVKTTTLPDHIVAATILSERQDSNNHDDQEVIGLDTNKFHNNGMNHSSSLTSNMTRINRMDNDSYSTDNDSTTNTTSQVVVLASTSASAPSSSSSSTLISTTTITNQTDESRNILFDTVQQQIQTWPKEIRNIIAGGIAGIIAKSVVAPIDRIKILFQVSAAKFNFSKLPKVINNIISNEGITALWKGNTATLLRVFPYSGVQFMVFDRIKVSILASKQQQQQNKISITDVTTAIQLDPTVHRISKNFGLTGIESLYAGMVAGAVSVLCTYPLDLARAQLAVLKKNKTGPNKGFFTVMYDNYNHGNAGIRGLFRGVTPTLIGILPYSGIAFALNEQAKREIQYVTGRDLTTIDRMQCGALAGLLAQSVAYPIEVIRRRIQTAGIVYTSNAAAETALGEVQVNVGTNTINSTSSSSIPKTTITTSASSSTSASHHILYKPGMKQIISELYAEQGIRGFYKGVSMNWLKGPVAFSISFTMFDIVQSLMESQSERELRTPHR